MIPRGGGWAGLWREARETLALAAPMIAGQLAQIAIGLADTVMVGRLGVVPLAACSFANTVLYLPLLFGMGAMTGTAVLASRALGAGEMREAGETLRHGVLFAAGMGLVFWGLLAGATPFFPLLGQPPEVLEAARGYLLLAGGSLLPALVGLAFKNHFEAGHRPWTPFWVTAGGVLLNVGLNWVFIFGELGAPAMGLAGAALATLLARVATAAGIALAAAGCGPLAPSLPERWLARFSRGVFARLLRLGLPGGTQLLIEVSAFSFAALMMGWLGAEALAAHQIALTCASTTFMVPLGISIALTVRIGRAAGASEGHRLRVIAAGGTGMAAGSMLFCGLGFLLLREPLAAAFVGPEGAGAARLAADLLLVAALFQIFDGAQVAAMGSLRGLADVVAPVWITVGCYWLFSLPLGYLAGFGWGLGPLGIWGGLAAGLGLAAVALNARLWMKTRHPPAARGR